MNIRQWIKPTGVATGIALISLFGNTPSLHAAVLQGPFGLQGSDVSDAELASMRGRFVDGRNVTFFGIRMHTQWQRHGGHEYNMEMHINFDLSEGRYRPRLTMFHTRDLGTPTDTANVATLDNVSDNGALENVSGVVQNIQVAGDSNAVHNGVEWTVTDQPGTQDFTDLIEIDGSGNRNHVSDDGVTTQVSVGANGIGYQVDVPDVGTVTQQISRSQLSGGNILQSTQLDSNLNSVLNQIGLTVELSPAAIDSSRLRRFHRALDNIRGL
ncbi:MAG: hypothetical protein OIF55_17905 [Amphritea sp.]|nr:hypothetical protein [Amphritea sp.]